ncbi:MAG: hypothetical protein ACC742_10835 [Thermoanaerobaculales bacterium]
MSEGAARKVFLCVVILSISVLSGVAVAQEVAGIRVEFNSLNGNVVNFDVVEFTDGGGNAATVQLQAIQFGDGSSDLNQVVTRTANTYAGYPNITGVYRGTFSHVYPTAGSYNLRAGDCCAGWPIDGTAYYITGYYTGSSDDSVTVWNNIQVDVLQQAVIPTLSQAGLAVLALTLLAIGVGLLRLRTSG